MAYDGPIMSWRYPHIYFATFSFFLSLNLFTAPILATFAQSQNTSKVVYNPPKNLTAPRVTAGGVTRSGNCSDMSCLIALMPGNKTEVEPFPLTVSERPTFFFSVPQMQGRAQFRLYLEGNSSTPETRIYKTVFPVSSTPGIISFSLPQDAPALEVDKNYRWEFSVGDVTNYETVKGFVRRVNLDAAILGQLNKAQPIEKAVIYAKAGIWFETLKTLADLVSSQPNKSELTTEWTTLLQSVALEKIASQPLVNCCKASN